MKLKKSGTTTILLTLLITVATSCSSTKKHVAATATPDPQAASKNNGEYYAVLEFNKGTEQLSEASKRDLREFVSSAKREGREIDDIRILSWADKEYPQAGEKLSKSDVKMANQRAKAIEKYLQADLKTDGNYATYNMAARPNKVSEFFRADDYKTKRIFEKEGSAPAGMQMEKFITSKAGKSLIMVDYE